MQHNILKLSEKNSLHLTLALNEWEIVTGTLVVELCIDWRAILQSPGPSYCWCRWFTK